MESFPEGALDESLEDIEGKAEAGMPQVEHIIDAINVFDIKVVVVVPAYWPSLIVPEPIAAVLEAVIPADHPWTPHVERVLVTEMGTVMSVRNAAIMAAATVVSNGLWLLPCGPLCLLCALWLLTLRLLGALWLLLVLCLLLALGLLLVLCLLLALGLLLVLCLLLALGLLLVLCLLLALGLRLVLRRLRFSSSALLLLAFLCKGRKGGCEK
jgi:hypothetical protein